MSKVNREILINALNEKNQETFTRPEVAKIVEDLGISYPHWFLRENKIGYTQYAVDVAGLKVVASNPIPSPVQSRMLSCDPSKTCGAG